MDVKRSAKQILLSVNDVTYVECVMRVWCSQIGGHSHSTYARRRGGGGREKAYVCVRGGRGVLLGQVCTHAKKK